MTMPPWSHQNEEHVVFPFFLSLTIFCRSFVYMSGYNNNVVCYEKL